jgi:hypothetical protein
LPIGSFQWHGKTPDGYRPECRTCSRELKRKREAADPVGSQIKKLARYIQNRTKYRQDKPKNNCYKAHDVKCKLGDTLPEVTEALTTLFKDEIALLLSEGKKPSIDRIDPRGDYEVGNIRVIELRENLRISRKGNVPVKVTQPNGTEIIYASIKDTALSLGCNVKTVARLLNGTTKQNLRGLKFERVV